MPLRLNLLLFNEKVTHQRQGTVKLHRGRKERSFLKHVCLSTTRSHSDRSLARCRSSVWMAGDVGWGEGLQGRSGKGESSALVRSLKVQKKRKDSFF